MSALDSVRLAKNIALTEEIHSLQLSNLPEEVLAKIKKRREEKMRNAQPTYKHVETLSSLDREALHAYGL